MVEGWRDLMDSIEHTTNDRFNKLRIALKDRKSDLRRIGLERLLSALYKRDLILTQLMHEVGVDKERIELLQLRHFPIIVDNLICHIRDRVCRVETGKRRFDIIERYFGLDGNMPARLSAIGTKYGVSRERIRQLKERCLVQLGTSDCINSIEDLLRLSARQAGQIYSATSENQELVVKDTSTIRLSNHRDMLMVGDSVNHLTEAQKDAYIGLTKSNRVKISGCSGSGKTLLSILLASDLASSGKRVLLTCYNKALALYLESVFSHQPNVVVASYHALCLRMGTKAGIPIPGGWNSSVWEKKFPQVLESAMQACPSLKFDAVLVDDAQDLKSKWWLSLTSCLKDIDKSGLYYFMDNNNLFYESNNSLPEVELSYNLLENLRTPRKLCPFVRPGYVSSPRFKSRAIVGEAPEFFHCETREDVRLTISHLFDGLTTSGGIRAQEIAVLTPRLTKQSDAYSCSTKNCGRLVVRYSNTSNHALLSRVETFKGLEKRCILLVDLDEQFASQDLEEKLKTLYLATSRSKEKFIMIGNRAGWNAIREIINVPEQVHNAFQQSLSSNSELSTGISNSS